MLRAFRSSQCKIFSALFSTLILGASLMGAVLSYFFQCHLLAVTWQIWSLIALISTVGLAFSLFFHFRKQHSEIEFKREMEKFEKECKMAIRGHLKASILFWIHFYRKEKVKSFDEAKRDIFNDLKREFTDVRWMESMLEEIRQEVSRYNK